MNNIIKHGAFVILLAVYTLIPANASAALLQHLHTSVDPSTGYWGWGDIEFVSESCEDNGSCTDYVADFNYTQEIGDAGEGGYELVFAQTDIYHADWFINPITWDLDVFHLTTNWVMATSTSPGTTQIIYGMMEFAINAEAPYAMVTTCFDSMNCGATPVSYDLHATPTHVPLPAAIWLFGSGLVGLVAMARRKKAA